MRCNLTDENLGRLPHVSKNSFNILLANLIDYLHQAKFIQLAFKFNEKLHAEICKDFNYFTTFYQTLACQTHFYKGGMYLAHLL